MMKPWLTPHSLLAYFSLVFAISRGDIVIVAGPRKTAP